jgi:hypothetical protein
MISGRPAGLNKLPNAYDLSKLLGGPSYTGGKHFDNFQGISTT